MMVFEEEEYDDDIISEMPEYSPKSDFSKAEMVKIAVQKCIELRAQEMKAGFWNTKLTKEGTPIREWKPDTRKQFISAINALRGLMSPEIKRDEHFLKFEKRIKEESQKLWNDYCYEELVMHTVENKNVYGGTMMYKKSGKKFMPEIGSTVPVQEPHNPSQVSMIQGGWDNQINAYWDALLNLYDLMFGQLNELIDRNNYFKQVISF